MLKIKSMLEKNVVLSIIETDEGLEVHINHEAYGNIAVIGLIEKIKHSLLNASDSTKPDIRQATMKKYDA